VASSLTGRSAAIRRVLPYDPRWVEQFKREAAPLQRALEGYAAGPVEHIGSTAVPGLAAKPIIDMLVTIRSFEDSGLSPPPFSRSAVWPHLSVTMARCALRRSASPIPVLAAVEGLALLADLRERPRHQLLRLVLRKARIELTRTSLRGLRPWRPGPLRTRGQSGWPECACWA
jgi:GrpB protein